MQEKNIKIKQKAVEKEYVKQRCNDKIAAEKEKLSKEMETRVKEHQEQLQVAGNKNPAEKVTIIGKELKKVEDFSYIGSKITANGKIQEERGQRMWKSGQFYHVVKDIIWRWNIGNLERSTGLEEEVRDDPQSLRC
uniref:Uncharacterized protein n=1 Tax=Timema bartmani TaxID=61472 RepID=A0A7R9I488_9NEOP|nr:unnamed protein product [Timema bartmani]